MNKEERGGRGIEWNMDWQTRGAVEDGRINEGCKTEKTYSRMQHPQSLFGYLRLSQHCTIWLQPSQIWRCMVWFNVGKTCCLHLQGRLLCCRQKQQMV